MAPFNEDELPKRPTVTDLLLDAVDQAFTAEVVGAVKNSFVDRSIRLDEVFTRLIAGYENARTKAINTLLHPS